MCKINTSTAIGAGQLPATLLQEAIPTGSAHTNMAAGKESHGWLSIPTYHTLGGNQFLLQASSFLQQRFVDCQLLANYQLRILDHFSLMLGGLHLQVCLTNIMAPPLDASLCDMRSPGHFLPGTSPPATASDTHLPSA